MNVAAQAGKSSAAKVVGFPRAHLPDSPNPDPKPLLLLKPRSAGLSLSVTSGIAFDSSNLLSFILPGTLIDRHSIPCQLAQIPLSCDLMPEMPTPFSQFGLEQRLCTADFVCTPGNSSWRAFADRFSDSRD